MRRWNSTYRFAWTPIITFGTRRLKFLEWVEQNLEPVAFSEGHDHVGIALFNRRLRLSVFGNRMVLEDGLASEAGVHPLADAVKGIFEVFEPRSISLTSASTAWSEGLDGEDYDEARSRFARATSGFDSTPSGFRPMDASALMDLYAPEYDCQVEWGIVSNKELLERVTRPQEGRLSHNRSATTMIGISASDLPPASVFVDSAVHRYDLVNEITNDAGIYEVIDDVDKLAREVATHLALSVAGSSDSGEA